MKDDDFIRDTMAFFFSPENMWSMHVGLCFVCCSGEECLDRVLMETGNDALNERDDEGYLVAPHFIRVRAAEKAGMSFKTPWDLMKGKTIRWARYGEEPPSA